MNWITVVGILLLAIGTLMTIYGPFRESQKYQRAVIAKIEQTKRELQSAVALNSDNPVASEKISNISRDFNKWATSFCETREQRIAQMKADINVKHFTNKSIRLEASKPIYPMLKLFLNRINQAIDAYNIRTPNEKIDLLFPQLPSDLYYDPDNPYILQITFLKQYSIFGCLCSEYGDSNVLSIYFEPSSVDIATFRGMFNVHRSQLVSSDLLAFDINSHKYSFKPNRNSGFLTDKEISGSFDEFDKFASDFAINIIEKCVIYYSIIQNPAQADKRKK